ncbi:MAG: cytochrome P450 [Deltaproteobacteria bacterium]
MIARITMSSVPRLRPNLISRRFIDYKPEHYQWMLEEAPLCRGRVAVIPCWLISRHADCLQLTTDKRFVRNRATATGGRRVPIPMPKSVALLAQGMIVEDDPEHRRLRSLVQKAFTPTAMRKLEGRVETITTELLDSLDGTGPFDLTRDWSLPIPVRMISEMLGVSADEMPQLRDGLRVLSSGLSGWALFRTFFLDLPRTAVFLRGMIARKRADPGDDILTALIHAEEDGECLSEDELVAMVFLLIIAGYETTVHLLSNSVLTLLEHPEALEQLQQEPGLIGSAVEELLRFCGPIHGTKPQFAISDFEMHGHVIPRGSAVFPVLGAANIDPRVFDNPLQFDIQRQPNHHLAFGHGPHICLGAALARMEARIALPALFARFPNLRLAVPREELRLQRLPLWHRYETMPVRLS